jgi:hypothetical protein
MRILSSRETLLMISVSESDNKHSNIENLLPHKQNCLKMMSQLRYCHCGVLTSFMQQYY